jgi:predicted nucleic acid-binding protein
MKVLVDTSIWSLALRRKGGPASLNDAEKHLVALLVEAIRDGRVLVAGPIRQEVLSGIATPEQFAEVKVRLDPFPDQPIASEDYIEAARLYNLCRRRGVECGAVDMLLCALAYRNEWTILSRDGGMERSIAAIEAETGKRIADVPASRSSR